MTDDMIKALAAKGGVIQINYHVGFLDQQFPGRIKKIIPSLAKKSKRSRRSAAVTTKLVN